MMDALFRCEQLFAVIAATLYGPDGTLYVQ